MAESDPIQSINLSYLVLLSVLRGEDIKKNIQNTPDEAGVPAQDLPSRYDDNIKELLHPLKEQLAENEAHRLTTQAWEIIWEIQDDIQGSDKTLRRSDIHHQHHDQLNALASDIDQAFGVNKFDRNSTSSQYHKAYNELLALSQPGREAQDTGTRVQGQIEAEEEPTAPPVPLVDPDRKTYQLYSMLQLAAAAGHHDGLKKEGLFKRSTPAGQILSDSTLRSRIEAIKSEYPEMDDRLLIHTCETVITRAQDAGEKKRDFFVDYSLKPKEILQLREAISLRDAFPGLENELRYLSSALANKERGHKMAMRPIEGLAPTVYTFPGQRDLLLQQKRAPEAAARPADTHDPDDRADNRGETETVNDPEPEAQDNGKWVRRTAAAAAGTAAVVSIGAGIKGNSGTRKPGAQNPDGTQQEQPRSRFGAGAKIALGAALALAAVLIAKPELIGLGGNSPNRSR